MSSEYYGTENYHPIKDWAKICATNKPIHANEAKKSDGPFYCPDTFEELIVRKCMSKQSQNVPLSAKQKCPLLKWAGVVSR